MEILLVGGDFDRNGGRKSSLISKIAEYLESEGCKVKCINGGSYDLLQEIYESFTPETTGVVLWFANVSNEEEKIRDIKLKSPRVILVNSKRNNNEYSFAQIVNKILGSKANLLLEFTKSEQGDKPKYKGSLYDPLGNMWVSSTDFKEVVSVMVRRLKKIVSLTRQETILATGGLPIPDEKDFFQIVKDYAKTFHNLIHPEEGVERFLGNASFRCERGFPSFRQDKDTVFVSRRNVDKRYIDKNNFVAVNFEEKEGDKGHIYYFGENKPSVDTPIQVRLYKRYPHVNYMLHCHCYIKDAPFTQNSIPCGAIEEVGEIQKVIEENFGGGGNYFINLRGHGSIALVEDWKALLGIDYVARSLPEEMR